MAAHQNQDDKFEANISILAGDKFKANISILAGDCHFVATSNSCCVAAFYKHSVFVLLSHFEAGLPYEDLMKRVPRLAWALAPTTGHWEVSGQRGPVALQRGHGEDGGAPHHCRPSSGTSTDWNHAEPGQPDPSLCICKSTVGLSGWEQERISSLGKRIFPSRIWDCLLVRAKQGLSEGLL